MSYVAKTLNTLAKRFAAIAPSVVALSVVAAPFHNLDFESASVVPDTGPQVLNQASAIPGWTANLGSSSNPGVLYHDITLGSAAIVLKDNETGDPRYGQFNLLLISGGSPDGVGPDLSASIAQVGEVPAGARTLLFDSPSVFWSRPSR